MIGMLDVPTDVLQCQLVAAPNMRWLHLSRAVVLSSPTHLQNPRVVVAVHRSFLGVLHVQGFAAGRRLEKDTQGRHWLFGRCRARESVIPVRSKLCISRLLMRPKRHPFERDNLLQFVSDGTPSSLIHKSPFYAVFCFDHFCAEACFPAQ